MSTAEIKLDLQRVSDDIFKVDVIINHVPTAFLGLSCHMSISGGVWSLKQQELAVGLEKLLFLVTEKKVSEKQGELVIGLSQRGAEMLPVSSGKVMSFYLQIPKTDNMLFQFKELGLYEYKNGVKVSVPVNFRDLSVNLREIPLQAQISSVPPLKVDAATSVLSQRNGVFTDQGIAAYYEVVGCGLLIIMVVFVVFYWFKKNKS
jgi:hypothetical protein